MAWIRRKLRDQLVYARVGADGALVTDGDGRVDIKYSLAEGAKIYRAASRNLAAAGEGVDVAPIADVEAKVAAHPEGAIVIYTDGACTGNPGPMGVGVVILRGAERRELSEFLGHGTNNIAELTAIELALDALGEADHASPVLVHADSSYAIGLLASGWRAKANQELVERLRVKARRFTKLRFVKVAGHAGVPENERCDELARDAITRTQA
ncbi:MAG: ribonuclease HI [Myxococcales bacterium]|nr:ribonuclease HI [Myxococcales bacterium]